MSADAGPSDHGLSRRDLLDHLLLAGGVVWAGGVALPTALYLWPAGGAGPGEDFVSAGRVDELPVGGARMVQKSGKPVLVLRPKEDEFRAFSAICTHLGCIVRWSDERQHIECPCHAGFFNPDGTVASGPPPRPLAEYRVVVLNDELRVYG